MATETVTSLKRKLQEPVITSTGAGTLALTADKYSGRVINFNDADGTITLPNATGTGAVFKVRVGTTFTGGAITVKPSTDEEFEGLIFATDTDADTALLYPALPADNFDTITLNGAVKGGSVGDFFTFTDVATGVWRIDGVITQSGGSEASPFSAAITS